MRRHHQKLKCNKLIGCCACRALPPLLLTAFALSTVLRSPSPPSFNPPAAEWDSQLKTHLPSNRNVLRASHAGETDASSSTPPPPPPPCGLLIDGLATWVGGEGFLCCDRHDYRSDVCYLRGDIRADSATSSIALLDARAGTPAERIRPYTRKFEDAVMRTIDEVELAPSADAGRCDVAHRSPAVVFSTGGYTGNVYHEFSDGLIPLYVTAARFAGDVVLVVLDYHSWWVGRYGALLEALTKHPIVDFRRDRRVHCFPEAVIGLRIHGELAVDPKLAPGGRGIKDFQALLHNAYAGHREPDSASAAPTRPCLGPKSKPKMVIFVRKKTRVLLNIGRIIAACRRAGFRVQVLNVKRTTPLSYIHGILVAADVMVAVHGAAVTHFLFMRPGSVLLQIVPVGLDWAAEAFYGAPARSLGLEYMEYRVTAEESSLAAEYGVDSLVMRDPSVISSRGWWEMKKVYMDKQNVTVNLKRFGEPIMAARRHVADLTCGSLAAS